MARSRYAPTPSGYLHAGNLANFERVRHWMNELQGEVLLRIDDMDGPRARPDYIEHIFLDLEKVGLTWDLGPRTPEEHHAIFSQRLRLAKYKQTLLNWGGSGLLYLCSCSRKEKVCECRNTLLTKEDLPEAIQVLEAGAAQRKYALKLKVEDSVEVVWSDKEQGLVCLDLQLELGDFVIWRKDGIPAYQWVSLLEDSWQSITHIVRGEDLLTSTAAQLYLSKLCGLEFRKVQFWHHELLCDEQGRKLSKSVQSS
jgi:glutamyl/glutaminyl-tRNA synthetase